MKILLIFTFHLISGPVGCFHVIGFPGGSVIILCKHQQYGLSDKYFCKMTPKKCIHAETQNSWVHKDRVSLLDSGHFTSIYRNLSLEDAGSYQCGETGVWNYTVDLTVKTDPCCLGPMTVTGYLGKTVTINCSYPAEFETNHKYFYRLDGQYFFILINTNSTKKGRFSISDDRRSKVVSVRISDVRGDDGGVYFCAVGIREKSVGFYTLFTRMQLIPAPGSSVIINIIIIIAVSVCAVLLLIGGLTLIFYKRRCTKTQDCSITSRGSGKNDTNEHEYENDLPGNQNIIRMGQIYHNLKSDTNQSDSVYQSLDLRSKEPDSVYHSLKPNTNPIMSGRP